MHAFRAVAGNLRVRFTPLMAGVWNYHVLSSIRRYDNQEASFTVADSGNAGMVSVANLRHWRTTNKKPHLLARGRSSVSRRSTAGARGLARRRKRDGFTHIRGPLLSSGAATQPFDADLKPDLSYFARLDDRCSRPLTAALRSISSGRPFLRKIGLLCRITTLAMRSSVPGRPLWRSERHLAGRRTIRDTPDSRALLQDLGSSLQKYDGYQHPCSTDARDSLFAAAAGRLDELPD